MSRINFCKYCDVVVVTLGLVFMNLFIYQTKDAIGHGNELVIAFMIFSSVLLPFIIYTRFKSKD